MCCGHSVGPAGPRKKTKWNEAEISGDLGSGNSSGHVRASQMVAQLSVFSVLGGSTVPAYLQNRNWLTETHRSGKGPRQPAFVINNIMGLLRACQRGLGVALLPDYLIEENVGLVQLFGEEEGPALDAFFVYPEELKSVARVQAFRDFLVSNAQRWSF